MLIHRAASASTPPTAAYGSRLVGSDHGIAGLRLQYSAAQNRHEEPPIVYTVDGNPQSTEDMSVAVC